MKKILYLTDLNYKANGRDYSREDIYITGILREYFDIALCHPKCSEPFEDSADLIVFRNTGGVSGFKEAYRAFLKRVKQKSLNTFNSFDGSADMLGKQYLIELTDKKYPVIPTVDSADKLSQLPESEYYVLKPKDGADSIGLKFVKSGEIENSAPVLIQPAIDFVYEVSFYFINNKFEYAMYAPDKSKRWELKEYKATDEDMIFAEKFIAWNPLKKGIQRVDACRTKSGELLLVELEDLNPFLSLLNLDERKRKAFMIDFICALNSSL